MKKTSIQIRVSEEEKEKIKNESKKLSSILGVKITISTFIIWLFNQHLKK